MEKKCKCCGNIFPKKSFYYSNNLNQHPDGCLDICENCLKETIRATQPKTFLWVLKECDVPFLSEIWYNLVQKYGSSCPTILKRYLITMKLFDFKAMRWEDTFYFLETMSENHFPYTYKKRKG